MISRAISETLAKNLAQFPIVSLTGPRQSGKTTLLKSEFQNYSYVSLEDPDVRAFAQDDPRAFLGLHGPRTIFDEAQRVPELFSYLQGMVDEMGDPGQYIISGSQNFLLMKTISQSLAGRVAVRHLMPLSYRELSDARRAPANAEEWVYKGGYPRLYDVSLSPDEYFPSYMQTYVDRDVRSEMGIIKIPSFNRFIRLCASRIGNLLNIQSLASDCGINVRTAKDWLGLLEQSFIIRIVQPYYSNLAKRLVKTPKLYFCDTGFACSLLGIESAQELLISSMRGALFENAIISELLKEGYAAGKEPQLFFYRDLQGREVDILIEKGGKVCRAIEVKASSTYNPKSFSSLDVVGELLDIPIDAREVVYSGSETMSTKHGTLRSFADL